LRVLPLGIFYFALTTSRRSYCWTSVGLKKIPTVTSEFAGRIPYLKSKVNAEAIWESEGGT
jgi:hypothetical protein